MGQPVPDNQSAGYTRRCTLNGNLDESSILSTSTKQEQAPWETGGLLLWRAAGFFCILVWPWLEHGPPRRDGGIGRHKRLKIARSNPYGFKSRSRHHCDLLIL